MRLRHRIPTTACILVGALVLPVNAHAGTCNADIDDNGEVGAADLYLLLLQFEQDGLPVSGDINGDDKVDYADLNALLGSYGMECPAACCLGPLECQTFPTTGDCLDAGGVPLNGAPCENGEDCGVLTAFGKGTGPCCEAGIGGQIGCEIKTCAQLVCAERDQCCDLVWDETCTQLALEMCGECGGCCGPNGTPGCNEPLCEEIVCAQDAFCCEEEWDTACASMALDLCTHTCGIIESACCFDDGSCDLLHPITCTAMGGLSLGGDTSCQTAQCPGVPVGACCLPEGGCQMISEEECAAAEGTFQGTGTLCQNAPCPGRCCIGGDCFLLTEEECAAAGGTFNGSGPCFPRTCESFANCKDAEGDCCSANGTLGCEDQTCCEILCNIDPFCCELVWDAICASIATQQCDTCGPCCEPHTGSGCNNRICQELVCDVDPACCDDVWDEACVEIANSLCSTCAFDGACCLDDGASCQRITEGLCEAMDGAWLGPGTFCYDNDSACQGVGACCLIPMDCIFVDEETCLESGGIFLGPGEACSERPCDI